MPGSPTGRATGGRARRARAATTALPTPLWAERLRLALRAMAGRQLDLTGVSTCLRCTTATARACVEQLVDAGVVCTAPQTGCGAEVAYRLHADAEKVGAYLEMLSSAVHARFVMVGRHSGKNDLVVDGRRFHIMKDDLGFVLDIGRLPARRDPLVAALFGDAGRRSGAL